MITSVSYITEYFIHKVEPLKEPDGTRKTEKRKVFFRLAATTAYFFNAFLPNPRKRIVKTQRRIFNYFHCSSQRRSNPKPAIMYRSSSSGRVSDEFFPHSAAVPTPAFSSPNLKSPSTGASDELPTYNPQSHVAKKERNRLRFAQNAVHLIPVVLVLSAIILWFFSSPGKQTNPRYLRRT